MSQERWQYLAPNPKSNYKQLFIKGTRIRAEAVYAWTVDGEPPHMTAEEVAVDMNLPLEAVKEAIAYCAADPPEVREDHRREEESMKASGLMDAEGNYIRKPTPPSPRASGPAEK
jgi:uncharacterized protein (DUF433 family)